MPVPKEHLWHVEAVWPEVGGSPRSGYLVHHRDDVWRLTDVAELAGFLANRQVGATGIAVPDPGSPMVKTAANEHRAATVSSRSHRTDARHPRRPDPRCRTSGRVQMAFGESSISPAVSCGCSAADHSVGRGHRDHRSRASHGRDRSAGSSTQRRLGPFGGISCRGRCGRLDAPHRASPGGSTPSARRADRRAGARVNRCLGDARSAKTSRSRPHRRRAAYHSPRCAG